MESDQRSRTRKIGSYELLKIIGKGSSSKVYKARKLENKGDRDDGNVEFWAVKRIKLNGLRPGERIRLEQEIEIYRGLDHPNIIRMVDVIKDMENNYLYIVLEYCDCGNLHRMMKKANFTEKHAAYYFLQLRNAFKYLDEKRIMHRDVKPHNLLLCNEYKTIKVADFGFAKEGEQTERMMGTLCGTPLYMAPEIIKKDPYTNKTDLWSLGIILYQMIYNKHPFEGSTNMYDLVVTIQSRMIQFSEKTHDGSDVTAECLDLMKRMLQSNYALRISWIEFFDHNWFKMFSMKGGDNGKNQILTKEKREVIKIINDEVTTIEQEVNDEKEVIEEDMMFDMDESSDPRISSSSREGGNKVDREDAFDGSDDSMIMAEEGIGTRAIKIQKPRRRSKKMALESYIIDNYYSPDRSVYESERFRFSI